MGKVITYIILVTFLLNTVSLNQLPKIPLLIIHYFEHQDSRSNLSFLQFLDMHYVGNDGNESDNDRDMELPYKKIDFNTLQGYTFSQVKTIVNTPSIEYKRQPCPLIQKSFRADPTLSSLFRPPKY